MDTDGDTRHSGMADAGRDEVGARVLTAWDAFLDRAAVPLQSASLPSSVVTIIQGTIVLAVVVANEFARRIALRAAREATER